MRCRCAVLCVALAGLLLLSCGGPEAKKMKFFEKGKALYAKKDYVKAGLEFKNAIQIDPKFDNAFYMLGMTQMMRGDLGGAYRSMNRAADLNPINLPAQVQAGKLLLLGGEKAKAMEKAELVLKEDPENVDAKLLKGAVYVVGGESGKAISYLEGMIAKGATNPEPFLLLARARLQLKDTRGAEGALLKGLAGNDNSLGLHRALADLYAATGRIREAAAEVKRVIDLEPENYGNRITLAGLYWDTRQEEKAREVLDALVAARPADDETRLDVARFCVSRGAFADAEKTLKEGMGKEGKGLKLRLALGDLYRGTGRTELAVSVLVECLALEKDASNPDAVSARNNLARVHLARQEVDKAEERVDEVIRDVPRNMDAHLIKGSIRLARRDGAGAVAQFRTVVSEKPQFIQGYLLLAEAHLQKNDSALALETLQNGLRVDPKSIEVRKGLGRYYASQGDFPRAEKYMRKVAEEYPKDVEIRAELGDLRAGQKDYKGAEVEYARVKSMAPKHPLGYVKMGGLHAGRGNLDRANAEFEQAAKIDPRIYNLLGRAYVEQRKYRKAIESYEKALEKQPGSWVAANDLASMLTDHGGSGGSLDKALALAENARRSRPDEPVIHDTIGWIHFRKGDTKTALEFLRAAQAKLPENHEINYHYGMALVKAGEGGQAKRYLQKAVDGKKEFFGKDEAARTLARL